MKSIKGTKYFLFLLIPALISFFMLRDTHSARADGGAPNLAYVSNTQRGISIVDIAQRKVTDAIPISGAIAAILLSVDGRLLYVTQPSLHRFTVVATKTKQMICNASLPGQPSLLALDPGTNTIYVGGAGSNKVVGLDPLTCAKKRTIQVSGDVTGLAVAVIGAGIAGGNGNQLWVAHDNGLSVFDQDGKQTASVNLQAHPQYLCIPPGNSAYVTTREGTVEAVDLKTLRHSVPLLSAGSFGPMDYDAITGEVYLPDLAHHQLDVLAPTSVNDASEPKQPRRTLALSAAPQAVAITNDGQLGFVALADGTVAQLDVPGRQVIATYRVGGAPHFVVTGLYPALLSFTPQQWSLITFLSNSLHYVAAAVILLAGVIAVLVQRRRARGRSLPS